MGVEQAEKATVIKESVLWGCPGLRFKSNLPFNGMKQVFATLLKEISTALFALFSNRQTVTAILFFRSPCLNWLKKKHAQGRQMEA